MSDKQQTEARPGIHFRVYGKAQPAGSKKGFPIRRANGTTGVVVVDANPRSKPWQLAVATAAREAYSGPLLTGPISINITFNITRPKSHFGTGKNAAKLKSSSPEYPTFKPDLLKLARGVEDALTGIVWRDDSQIVHESLVKVYCDMLSINNWPAHAQIEIWDSSDENLLADRSIHRL